MNNDQHSGEKEQTTQNNGFNRQGGEQRQNRPVSAENKSRAPFRAAPRSSASSNGDQPLAQRNFPGKFKSAQSNSRPVSSGKPFAPKRSSFSSNNGAPAHNGAPARPSFSSNNGAPAHNGAPARPSFSSNNGAPAHNGAPARPSFSSNNGAPAYNGAPARPSFSSNNGAPAHNGAPVRPSFSSNNGAPAHNGAPARSSYSSNNGAPTHNGAPARGNAAPFRGTQSRAVPGGFKRPAAPYGSTNTVPTSNVNARRAALEAFSAVLHKDAYASQAINEQLKDAGFSQVDKRLCTSIVYRTLENLIAIDFALSGFLKEPDALDNKVRDILRISVCQTLFMDKIPENAVADEAVKLTRALGFEALTGVVNGVLRNLMRGRDEIKWPTEDEGAHYLSIKFSMPEWLVQRLIDAYGMETAKNIVSYRTEDHFMTIRPNMMRLDDAAFEELLKKKVWQAEKGLIPHAWRVRGVSQVACDEDYLGGQFSIQGESSILCAQIANVARGAQVLDCCAAPGGKTAYMAEAMNGTGRVYAWDLHEHRVTLIKAMVRRLRLDNIRPAVRDASVLKEDLTGMIDTVLLDAPCTGLGVMDDKPDIKYRVTPESIDELVNTQRALLETCCQYVKKGGTLVYSTCSILPDENERQIERFLAAHPEFTLDKIPEFVDERLRSKAGKFGLQLLECLDGVEGFFIARLKRTGY